MPAYTRTLCFGGSFNPIHLGHLTCARAVAPKMGFEQVLLIPSARPPHKPGNRDLAGVVDRLAMCNLVAADDPLFSVSNLETQRTGPSYTIDTARELRGMGMSSVSWLIGADMAKSLPKWHQADDLLREVHFVIIARPGFAFDWPAMPEPFRALRQHVVEAPLLEVSATEIRQRVREGKSIDHLVPATVASYIREHRLYI